MKLRLLLLLAMPALVACSAETLRDAADAPAGAAETRRIDEARQLAQLAVFDPRFVRTLQMLGPAAFGCAPCRQAAAPPPSGPAILALIQRHGLFGPEAIRVKKSYQGRDLPFAVTDICGAQTYLNADLLHRDPASLANTLVHERIHSFCYLHAEQSRDRAYCDPSYVVGDLAEAVLRDRAALGDARRVQPVAYARRLCPSLCRALLAQGIAVSAAQCAQ